MGEGRIKLQRDGDEEGVRESKIFNPPNINTCRVASLLKKRLIVSVVKIPLLHK